MVRPRLVVGAVLVASILAAPAPVEMSAPDGGTTIDLLAAAFRVIARVKQTLR